MTPRFDHRDRTGKRRIAKTAMRRRVCPARIFPAGGAP